MSNIMPYEQVLEVKKLSVNIEEHAQNIKFINSAYSVSAVNKELHDSVTVSSLEQLQNDLKRMSAIIDTNLKIMKKTSQK